MNQNEVNNDSDTIKIDAFRVELKNFADDVTLEMCPMVKKCNLTKKIKYGYRLNLQHGMNQFYNWTLYFQLILAQAKCSTVTFSRKQQQFHAYVYKLGENKLELIHSNKNCPQKCKHNERQCYVDAIEEKEENNGDSDLDNLDKNGRKINEIKTLATKKPKNPIFKIDKKGKQAKRQKEFGELPPNVRLLGVFLDPELYFDEHIRIVTEKAEKKMNALMRLAYCKHYNFNPFAIYKLFETVIRPRVEYALCTASISSRMNIIEKLQKRAIRIALQAKRDSPSVMMNEITNTKTIEQKLKEQQVKMWNKYKRAPDTMLQKETFNRWKQYIDTNDHNSKSENGEININKYKLNYISKSPLSRCHKVMREIYPHKRLLRDKIDSVMKPPPTYEIQFPTNLHQLKDEAYMENVINNNNNINNRNSKEFYCDGSCLPNPGPGGAGFYSPNFCIKSKIYAIDHDTTINYCELMGVKIILQSVLRYTKFQNQYDKEIDFEFVNIFTDSSFVFNMLEENGYPKIDYYYEPIQEIFDICNRLGKMSIDINIIKVKSHIGIEGNRRADVLAKEAANLAKMCKIGESKLVKYNINKNHVSVDIAKDLIQLRKKEKENRKHNWEKIKMKE